MNLYAINFIFFKNSEFKVYCFSSLKYTTKYDKVGEHYQWLLGKWEEERKTNQNNWKILYELPGHIFGSYHAGSCKISVYRSTIVQS